MCVGQFKILSVLHVTMNDSESSVSIAAGLQILTELSESDMDQNSKSCKWVKLRKLLV